MYNGYRLSFAGLNRPGRGVNHTLYTEPRLKKEYSYYLTPPLGLHGLLYGERYLVRLIRLTLMHIALDLKVGIQERNYKKTVCYRQQFLSYIEGMKTNN